MKILHYEVSEFDPRYGARGTYDVKLDMRMSYVELMELRMMLESRWAREVHGHRHYVRPEPEPYVPAFDRDYDPRHYELHIAHGHPTVAKDAQLPAAPTSPEPISTVKLLGR